MMAFHSVNKNQQVMHWYTLRIIPNRFILSNDHNYKLAIHNLTSSLCLTSHSHWLDDPYIIVSSLVQISKKESSMLTNWENFLPCTRISKLVQVCFSLSSFLFFFLPVFLFSSTSSSSYSLSYSYSFVVVAAAVDYLWVYPFIYLFCHQFHDYSVNIKLLQCHHHITSFSSFGFDTNY